MPIYRNSKADTYYNDGADYAAPCQVRIENGSITVSYEAKGQQVDYEGKEIEPGHFILKSASMEGNATLHKVPNEGVLEGWWLEGDYEGMWRIKLED
jgi:hypothetical protein